ncbi:MAG: Outer membrane lipoprotein carrier protein LolA [Olavius algarvensis Gamma 1 endosymbiont]|nr:MAG: Outer membrane lipoprotein carrier protein LolA [Olavius algarvensis Gamma 1 endosymbiont]
MTQYPITSEGNITDHPRSRGPAGPWIVLLALLLCGPVAAATGPERLEDYMRGLESLTSSFQQTTRSTDGGRLVESRGTLYLKRPGKLRWEYDSPVEQVIIADGKRVWLHDRELDQVSHQSQCKALGGTPAQLLVGEGPIDRYFEVSPWEGGDGREWVELRPRTEDTQVVRIRIGFIGERLDTLEMEDTFGQLTRFLFTKTKRNPMLAADLFRFDTSAASDFLQID